MAGREREFLEMLPLREHDHRYMEADNSMRDFWRSGSDRESLQEMRGSRGRDEHAVVDMRNHPSQSLYNYGGDLQQDLSENVVTMAVRSSLGSVHHEGTFYTEYNHPYQHVHLDSSATSSSALLPTYTNFLNANHGLKTEPDEPPRYMTNDFNHGEGRYFSSSSTLVPQVAIPMMSHDVFSVTTASESINRHHDMDYLRRELAYKCPRSSDLLMAITSTAEATVREHGSATSGVSTDDDNDDESPDETDQNPRLSDPDQDLRGAIVDHPYYPDMVDSHIRIFKVGAPRELRNKLDEVMKKFHRLQEGSTTRIGDDPSLDYFMKSYADLLTKLGDDLEEPLNKFMQFKDATTKRLENICGHYIETVPDETENYGFDVGPIDGAQNSDDLDMQGDEDSLYSYGSIDESIIIDPSAPEEELRKMLMLKYGRHIGGLKAEFNRVRKKGKLPLHARSVLKDWFNRHTYWPYPSELEKQYLQQVCNLNLKQINNWFINERKRHWSCEGKCMHPNTKIYNSGSEGKSNSEHAE